jgi:homoserine O-acetyltransferase
VPVDERLFDEESSHSQTSDDRRIAHVGPLVCESGETLHDLRVAYQVWGELNSARDNLIVVCHALSGDSNVAGWWSALFGPGKVFDPTRFCIVGTNALGGCRGTTGPADLDSDGRPYGSRFPKITVGDMVTVQQRLLNHLDFPRPAMVCGGSMGSMQALEWGRRDATHRVWVTAGAARHSAMQIGFNEAARQAIYADSMFSGGDYYDGPGPTQGLAVARMLGHLSYLSDRAFEDKFGRSRRDDGTFQVASYLQYNGTKFTTRFDANSLIVLSRAIDAYDCSDLSMSRARYLVTAYTSDWLYPSHQSEVIHELALRSGCDSHYQLIDLPHGHDSFLLDSEVQGRLALDFVAG